MTADTEHVPCDLCGSSDAKPLYDKGRGDEVVPNVICWTCGLVFISPRPRPDAVTDQYLDGDFSIAARGSAMPSTAKFRASERAALRRYRRLTELGCVVPAGQYLEVGSGVGSLMRLMKAADWSVHGLEPDAGFARAGAVAYGVTIDTALYEDVDYGERRFDLIASFHVLEHVLSPTAFLEKAHAELRQDGRIFIEVPSIDRPYGGNLDRFFWSAHLTSFSRNTLLAFMDRTGFDVEWCGHDGDFLQVIARRGHRRTPTFPADRPGPKRAEVRAKGVAFRAFREGPWGGAVKSLKDDAALVASALKAPPDTPNRVRAERRASQLLATASRAPAAVHLCATGSLAAMAWREAVDRRCEVRWTVGDLHALEPVVPAEAPLILGPTMWSLDELQAWTERLETIRHTDAVWVPSASFEQAARDQSGRWRDLILRLAQVARVGIAEPNDLEALGDAAEACSIDPPALPARAFERPQPTAFSDILGVCLKLHGGPHPASVPRRLVEIALVAKERGWRVRIVAAESGDIEAIPHLHGAGLRPDIVVLGERSVNHALRELGGLRALMTNRSELAGAAKVAGVVATDGELDDQSIFESERGRRPASVAPPASPAAFADSLSD